MYFTYHLEFTRKHMTDLKIWKMTMSKKRIIVISSIAVAIGLFAYGYTKYDKNYINYVLDTGNLSYKNYTFYKANNLYLLYSKLVDSSKFYNADALYQACNLWILLADDGYSLAQLIIGNSYLKGRCVRQSEAVAVFWYKKAAMQGLAWASLNLGLMYESGIGVQQSSDQAKFWYKKASEQGNLWVQLSYDDIKDNIPGKHRDAYYWLKTAIHENSKAYNSDYLFAFTYALLGYIYSNGSNILNIQQDYNISRGWYEKAADQGIAEAQYRLGEMYKEGMGVISNNVSAQYWYKAAAEQGHAEAQYMLGEEYARFELYLSNEEMKERLEHAKPAFFWYTKAANQGHVEAQYKLGEIYEQGIDVYLTKNDLASVFWYQIASRQGHEKARDKLSTAKSQFYVGILYNISLDDSLSHFDTLIAFDKYPFLDRKASLFERPDIEKSTFWFQKALEQGYPKAQTRLGLMYERGWRVEQNDQQAVFWYRKAAEQGHAEAQYYLGWMYEKGRGGKQNYKQAAWWYRKAAKQGIETAQHHLGRMYENGWGVKQDITQAFFWYEKAAERGRIDFINNLNSGVTFEKDRRVNQDFKQAFFWYKQPAEQEKILAQSNLELMHEWGAGQVVPQNHVLEHIWLAVKEQFEKDRDRIKNLLTGEQLAEAGKRATSCLSPYYDC